MPPQQPGQPQYPFSYRPTGAPVPQQPLPPSYPQYRKRRLSRTAIIVLGTAATILIIIALVLLTSNNGSQNNTVNDHARTDINNLQVSLQSYFAEGNADYASYPTLTQLNDAGWRSTNMTGLDKLTLSPAGSTSGLVSDEPTGSAYSYAPAPAGCTNTITSPCTSYRLSGKQTSGKLYVQKSDN